MLFHGIGGGTGSGIAGQIMKILKDSYGSKKLRFSNMIFPSPWIRTSVIESYNAIIGLSDMLEYADAVTMFDNESLYEICD